MLPVVKNKTGNSVNHHSYQQSTIIWLAINKGKWKRHQCVRGRSFREFFQMLLLKSTADMINFFFFSRKEASYSKPDFFLNLSMTTSIKSARRRYTVQVEADRIMKSVTGWGSRTPRPNAYGMFA